MPLYVYGCQPCNQETDISHPITEEPIIKCDNCANPMTRKPQNTSNTFRGSGFYTTDNKKK